MLRHLKPRVLHCQLILAPALVATIAGAQSPPWLDPNDIPPPSEAQSVMATEWEVPVFVRPDRTGPKRGVLAPSVPLPFFALQRAPGCRNRWVLVGPDAWVCQDFLTFSSSAPIEPDHGSFTLTDDGLPMRYYFVATETSWGYERLKGAGFSTPDQEFERGFAVAILEQRTHNGESYGRTSFDIWLPMRDLAPVRPFLFQGAIIEDGLLDMGWIFTDQARFYSQPKPFAGTSKTLPKFEKLEVLEEKSSQGRMYYRVGEKLWVSDRDFRKPSIAPPPDEVKGHERWLDIELKTQTLVAYEGSRPVFATLVSTGRGKGNSPFATPLGTHRIWVKLVTTNMDNLEDQMANQFYSIEDVPYVQFFSKGVGLHAAFWHRKFGQVRSHGCVNLAPLDARWLFGFTTPMLPSGWRAVFPTERMRSTVVRVR